MTVIVIIYVAHARKWKPASLLPSVLSCPCACAIQKGRINRLETRRKKFENILKEKLVAKNQ